MSVCRGLEEAVLTTRLKDRACLAPNTLHRLSRLSLSEAPVRRPAVAFQEAYAFYI